MLKKKIVIIDDNVINIKIAFSALREDFEVFTALSGEKVFTFLSKIIPDLIILDIEMPGMNGFEIFDLLKANPETAGIPVIFLTSCESIEYEKKSYLMGAADFIHKPYYPPFLCKRIKSFFQLNALEKENRNFEEKLEYSQTEQANLQMRILKTIIELIERRNEISSGHVERTQKYVEVLLDVLVKNNIYGDIIASWERDLVLQSTMLYDLGKLSVQDAILLKPDKLEESEYTAVKMHPLEGVKIINEIRAEMAENSTEANILEYAKEFAGFHHEKWDGTGYPNGLTGYNIPLPGRLMAIADVYDALISKRVYKNPYTHKEAAEIISREKGTHFDPVLVDVFISVADKFSKIAGQGIISG